MRGLSASGIKWAFHPEVLERRKGFKLRCYGGSILWPIGEYNQTYSSPIQSNNHKFVHYSGCTKVQHFLSFLERGLGLVPNKAGSVIQSAFTGPRIRGLDEAAWVIEQTLCPPTMGDKSSYATEHMVVIGLDLLRSPVAAIGEMLGCQSLRCCIGKEVDALHKYIS